MVTWGVKGGQGRAEADGPVTSLRTPSSAERAPTGLFRRHRPDRPRGVALCWRAVARGQRPPASVAQTVQHVLVQ